MTVAWVGEGLRVLLPDGPSPRRVPRVPWPSRAYLPGVGVHPRKAAADGYDRAVAGLAPWRAGTAAGQPRYELALDLLEAGYPWEAHELLEQGWLANGRDGEVARALQRLIWAAASRIAAHRGLSAAAARLEARSRA